MLAGGRERMVERDLFNKSAGKITLAPFADVGLRLRRERFENVKRGKDKHVRSKREGLFFRVFILHFSYSKKTEEM